MKYILAVLSAAALAGCLSVEEPEIARWPVDFSEVSSGTSAAGRPVCGTVRLAQVHVRSPYDSTSLAVLRGDGTVAFDPFNEFAAAPSLLLKGVVFDALLESGRFGDVVSSSSVVREDCSAEVLFTRLCLDCTETGGRRACCDLRLRIVKDRETVRCVKGSGVAEATDGNYGAAFSKAVSLALSKAAFALD